VQKFIFTLMVIVGNAVLSVLLYELSSSVFSWLFFSLILSSLAPKLYGSFRYLNSENSLESKGMFPLEFIFLNFFFFLFVCLLPLNGFLSFFIVWLRF
jgi:hypothetical protein